MKELWQHINKFYLVNFSLAAAVVLVIVLMFAVQFKVESLQNEMLKTEGEIIAFEDEIQLLEVEWVYLTRPARLRTLASNYLQDNNYALASQIKEESQLEKFYLAHYEKVREQESQMAEQVSF